MAIGVYGQFIYVNPMRRVVIAKNSAYINYKVDGERMEYEAIEAFRAIARQLCTGPSLRPCLQRLSYNQIRPQRTHRLKSHTSSRSRRKEAQQNLQQRLLLSRL
jgi:hypothetical protein